MLEAVAYCRLSDKDSSANSINNQKKRIQEYCTYHKISLVNVFVDDGKSGWTFDRPAFVELEKFCKSRKTIKYLIITHFDRFSRADPIDAMVKERYFRDKLNVKVLQVNESPDIDTSNPTYLMLRFMTAFVANEERSRIVDRVKNGIRYSLLQGRYCSNAPYGYTNGRDEQNRPILLIDEIKSAHVKTIFKRFLLGDTQEQIKRLIKPKGFNQNSLSAITRILQNPIYAGLVNVPAHNDQPARLVKGIHTPLITEEVYWLVQAKFNDKYTQIVKRDEVYLRGVIRCKNCGKLLTAAASKGKYNYYWYYYCKEDRKNNYNATKVHKLLDTILENLSIKQEDAEMIMNGVKQNLSESINTRTKDLMRLNIQIQRCKDAITGIEQKYLLSNVSEATFNKTIIEKNNLLQDLLNQKNDLEVDTNSHYDKLEIVLTKMQDIKAQFHTFDVTTKHKFLQLVFGNTIVYTGESVRTPFLHPMFSFKDIDVKGFEILSEIKKSHKSGSNLDGWTIWEDIRTLFEMIA
jgi:DNA invertase Pin-like site-specific DNA recombinase